LLLLRVKDLLLKHVLLVLKELARRVLGRRGASANTYPRLSRNIKSSV
jgi:hypothetical protein